MYTLRTCCAVLLTLLGCFSEKIRITLIPCLLVSCLYFSTGLASQNDDAPITMLPFPKGKGYRCTQNSGDTPTHFHSTTQYALDFATPVGSDIVAAAIGTAYLYDTPLDDLGLHVKIDHGNGYYTLYAHLSKLEEDLDEKRVLTGELIGYSGNTGTASYGAHLHFGLQEGDAGKSGGSSDSVQNFIIVRNEENAQYSGIILKTAYSINDSGFVCDESKANPNGKVYMSVTRDLSKRKCAKLKFGLGDLCWERGPSCLQGINHEYYNKYNFVPLEEYPEYACRLIDYLHEDNANVAFFDFSHSASGRGGAILPDDIGTQELLPNFVTIESWLGTSRDEKDEETAFFPGEKAVACSLTENIGDAGSPEDIKVMFLLSNGYKEDSHSEWQQIGELQNIRDYNMDVGDVKKECTEFNVPDKKGVYNIVACPDRTKTKNNGDGDVVEIHKSDNCSTEAVFTVLPKNNLSVGYFDNATCNSFSGWAKDPDTTDPIYIHFYADGPAGTGTFVGAALADVYRGDLPYDDKNHGFSFTLPNFVNDGTEHQIYAYAIDSGCGENPLLAHSPKTVQCGLTADQLVAVIAVIENVILADDEEENKGWLPAILKLLLLD